MGESVSGILKIVEGWQVKRLFLQQIPGPAVTQASPVPTYSFRSENEVWNVEALRNAWMDQATLWFQVTQSSLSPKADLTNSVLSGQTQLQCKQ